MKIHIYIQASRHLFKYFQTRPKPSNGRFETNVFNANYQGLIAATFETQTAISTHQPRQKPKSEKRLESLVSVNARLETSKAVQVNLVCLFTSQVLK